MSGQDVTYEFCAASQCPTRGQGARGTVLIDEQNRFWFPNPNGVGYSQSSVPEGGIVVAPTGDMSGALDYAALSAAITVAGIGGTVLLYRNANYYLDRGLVFLRNQRLIPNGATIHRAAQVNVTTTTTITANVTNTVTVSNGALLRPGWRLIAVQGANIGSNAPAVQSIVGNVVTMDASWNASCSGTTTLYSTFNVLTLAEGCILAPGLTIDGHRDAYSYARWESTTAVKAAGGGIIVDGVDIVNEPGEGIQESASYLVTTADTITANTTTSVTVSDASGFSVRDYIGLYAGSGVFDTRHRTITGIVGNVLTVSEAFGIAASGTSYIYKASVGSEYKNAKVVNSGGNGIHLSGSVGSRITNPHLHTNNQNTNVGHADGAVAFSNGVERPTIDGGRIVNNPLCAVGSYDSIDNSGLLWTGTTVDSCAVTFEGNLPNGAGVDWLVIDGINVYPSGGIIVNQTNGAASSNWGKSVRLLNIRGIKCSIFFNTTTNFDIENCWLDFTGDTTTNVVTLGSSCKNGTIRGGQITGGGNGIYQTGTDTDGIWIGGGIRLIDQNNRGVYANAVAASGGQVTIDGAIIRQSGSGSATYVGVDALDRTAVLNCDISLTASGVGVGIRQSGNNAIAQGNTVRVSGASCITIRTFGGSTGHILSYNRTRNITNANDGISNGGGASNTAVGNILLAT